MLDNNVIIYKIDKSIEYITDIFIWATFFHIKFI